MELTIIENQDLAPIARIIYNGIKHQFEGVLQEFVGHEVSRACGIKLLRAAFTEQMKLDNGVDAVFSQFPVQLQSTKNAKILYNWLGENVPKMLDEIVANEITK